MSTICRKNNKRPLEQPAKPPAQKPRLWIGRPRGCKNPPGMELPRRPPSLKDLSDACLRAADLDARPLTPLGEDDLPLPSERLYSPWDSSSLSLPGSTTTDTDLTGDDAEKPGEYSAQLDTTLWLPTVGDIRAWIDQDRNPKPPPEQPVFKGTFTMKFVPNKPTHSPDPNLCHHLRDHVTRPEQRQVFEYTEYGVEKVPQSDSPWTLLSQ